MQTWVLMLHVPVSLNNENQSFRFRAERRNSVAEKHSFVQNVDLRFLMNKIILSILTIFTSCKHRHQHYICIIQIFGLLDLTPKDLDLDLAVRTTF